MPVKIVGPVLARDSLEDTIDATEDSALFICPHLGGNLEMTAHEAHYAGKEKMGGFGSFVDRGTGVTHTVRWLVLCEPCSASFAKANRRGQAWAGKDKLVAFVMPPAAPRRTDA